jgi:hypothetical protein
MISHGGIGIGEPGSLEINFLGGVSLLLMLAVPAAICLAVCKLFVTNRRTSRQGLSTLGLNDPKVCRDRADSWVLQISPFNLFVYSTTWLVTFDLGCLVVLLLESLR